MALIKCPNAEKKSAKMWIFARIAVRNITKRVQIKTEKV